MKTIEDLPLLKAQAAELERLIQSAPESAIIARGQYEDQRSVVLDEINRLETQLQVDQTCQPTGNQIEQVRKHPAFAMLKDCQLRILCEIVTGANEACIAKKLKMSTVAVHKYAKGIYSCLNVHSHTLLIKMFRECVSDSSSETSLSGPTDSTTELSK